MVPIHPDDNYDLFVFAAPDEDPTAWKISYDKVEEHILRTDPRAQIKRDRTRPGNYRTFRYAARFPFDEVEWNVGADHDSVSISHATLDTVAHFIAWFRTTILPPGAPIQFKFSAAIEDGAPPGHLPPTDDVPTIRATLEEYVRQILQAEESDQNTT